MSGNSHSNITLVLAAVVFIVPASTACTRAWAEEPIDKERAEETLNPATAKATERAAEALQLTTDVAKGYEFEVSDEQPRKLAFHPASILRWSNPAAGRRPCVRPGAKRDGRRIRGQEA